MRDGDDVEWATDTLGVRRKRTPDAVGLIDATADQAWTFADLDAFVDRVAIELADLGVEAGDTVATLVGSRPISVAASFASIRDDVTLAPLNVELDRETIARQLGRLDPDLLLCADATERTATEAFDGTVASVDSPSVEDVAAFAPSADAGATRRSGANAHPDGPDRTVLVVFTSGTTGEPKGVRLTVRNLLASATASAQRLGVTPRDRWLSPLPTYHVGGIAPFVRSTVYGTTAVLQRGFEADATTAILRSRDVNCVSLVPTMLRRVLDAGWRPDPGFRFVLLGGGPAPESLLERCRDLDVPVCPTYGTTETASQVATATPGEAVAWPGTVGRPVRGADVRIEADGVPSDPGVVGELVVSGPIVTPGYLEGDATTFEDGHFRTGDLATRDEAGRLRIVGRADDAIVTGGENVRPATLEDALRGHPAVRDAAVVGVPDDEWGERVVALAVGDGVKVDELLDHCRDRVPAFALPKSIRVVDALPRTPSGTVDRDAARERFR